MVINFDSLLTLNGRIKFFVFSANFLNYLHISINCGAIEVNCLPRPLPPSIGFPRQQIAVY